MNFYYLFIAVLKYQYNISMADGENEGLGLGCSNLPVCVKLNLRSQSFLVWWFDKKNVSSEKDVDSENWTPY